MEQPPLLGKSLCLSSYMFAAAVFYSVATKEGWGKVEENRSTGEGKAWGCYPGQHVEVEFLQ